MKNQDAVFLEAPTPIAYINSAMKFVGANNKFIEILNLKSFSVLENQPFSHCFESLEVLSLVERFIKSEQSTTQYSQSLLIDRKTKTFNFIFKKIKTSEGTLVAIYADDQTLLLEKEQELEALRQSSIAASRMAILGEMAGGIAHEINNPLSVILGLANQLQRFSPNLDKTQTEEYTKKLQKIKSTTLRIDKIVKGLKLYARDGSADPFQSMVVANLINDSLELCSDQLKMHEINLIIEDIDPSIQLDCRGTQISQVILNLISNAKDAIKNKHNEEKWIRVGAKDVGNAVEFSLTDSGKGIEPDICAKILQPFFTTKAVGEGTGLGLTISKKIIESHSGKLSIAQNTPNTTFIFSIPKGLSISA